MAVKNKNTASKKEKTKSPEKNIKVRLARSLVGRPQSQREIVRGLGLRKVNSTAIRKDCPEIRGMIFKVSHLVQVEELSEK